MSEGTGSETGHGEPQRSQLLQRRSVAVAAAVLALAILVVGGVWYGSHDHGASRIVEVELAGSVDGICMAIVAPDSECDALPLDQADQERIEDYEAAVDADFLFIIAYGLTLAIAGALGLAVFFTGAAQNAAKVALGATVVAVGADAVENLALLQVLRCLGAGDDCGATGAWALAAQALAFVKFVALIPAVAVGAIAVLTVLWRGAFRELALRRRRRKPEAERTMSASVARTVLIEEGPAAGDVDGRSPSNVSHWRRNTELRHVDRPRQQVGICASGGGIRSGTFCLGAFEALREAQLEPARYLVSVSGGGYTAGAMRLALQAESGPGSDATRPPAAGPDTVFDPGSPEMDHLRRHARYLADGAGQWLLALATVVRGLVASLVTLVLVVLVPARLLAHFYSQTRTLRMTLGDPWPPPTGISWAIGVVVGVALAAWLVRLLLEGGMGWQHVRRACSAISRASGGAALALATFGIAVPLVAWGVEELFPKASSHSNGTQATGAAATATTAGLIATIAAIGWRQRKAVGGVVARVRTALSGGGERTRASAPLVQRLLVYAGLLTIVAALLVVFGRVVAAARPLGATVRGPWPDGVDEWHLTLGAVLALLVLGAVVDQTRWSLHPFYRRRLASAFAVRRVERDGEFVALPYDYDKEGTRLDEYDTKVEGFPQVIFSTAGHVSGQEHAPPGRRVVPFTMSCDAIGAPSVGYMSTKELVERARPLLAEDLTVQAAMAVSGAAFASAMGRQSRPFSVLLTLTNARLGTWVPNPVYLRKLAEHPDAWHLPDLPSRRRITYLARELLGAYPVDGPLLFVTDGGHYENLGLVELLRLRCSTIYCFDASGDDPGLATTLAEAVTLASEELGVEITLDHPEHVVAGSGKFEPPRSGLFANLLPRLAQSSVVTGKITYPDLGEGLPAAEGRLVVGKSTLTPELPYDVLAYAARTPTFPFDSTGDQWFDHGQFDAYLALGRWVGTKVAEAARQARRRYP